MTERIARLCAEIPKVSVFADIGCDHGYCAQYALGHSLCERAYITDISAKCLAKAEKLLAREIEEGRCIAVCCDGFSLLPELPDCALVAGLGGEEICRMLEGELPNVLVLQPMKNADKVRAKLIALGRRIVKDETFASGGKFYDLIVSEGEGEESYTDFELEFGRDNLKKPSRDFIAKLEAERALLSGVLNSPLGREAQTEVLARLRRMEVILNGCREED